MKNLKTVKSTFYLITAALSLPYTSWGASDTKSQEAISYASALQRAVAYDPRTRLYDTLTEAAEGQVEQADLPPNPVVGAEIENFLGTGPISGVQGLEVTLGISQIIETADKQALRTDLARKERNLVDWQREATLAELESRVRMAFVEALLAQEAVALRREQLELAQESEIVTSRMVQEARVPQVESTRATLAVRQQQFALDQAMRELVAAKTILAVLWGGNHDSFVLEGSVVLDDRLPGFTTLAARLTDTAHLARFDALSRSREAALELEKAQATPDVEVFAGGRYFNEADGNFGFVAGVAVPWPLFDRNQGNIRTARANLRAVEHQRDAVRQDLLIRLNRAYQSLSSAHAEAGSIKTELIISAEQAMADTVAGYSQGRFTQLAVLQSRETLFEVREAYLAALMRYAMAQAEIEALTRPSNINTYN